MKIRAKKIFMVCAWAVNGVLALGLLASGYGGLVDPHSWSLPAMMTLTFPIWLAAVIVGGVVDLLINRRMALIPLGALILSLGPILTYCPLNFARHHRAASEHGQTFSVLTYNVDNLLDQTGYNFQNGFYKPADSTLTLYPNPTISYVLEKDASVVMLHEMTPMKQQMYVTLLQSQVDSINAIYPYQAYNTFYEALLSQYPMRPVELRQPVIPYAKYVAGIADIQGHEVLLIGVHLQSFLLSDDDKALYSEIVKGDADLKALRQARHQLGSKLSHTYRLRADQAGLLREQIDSLGIKNVIIGGDFNDVADSYTLRTIAGDDFKSAFAVAGLGPKITYHSNYFYFHIDHILYRGDMEAIGYERGKCPHSDHYPVMATFLWAPE